MDHYATRAKEWDNPSKMAMSGAFVDAINAKNIVAQGSRFMDVGCGTGLVGLAFTDVADQVLMVDTSPAMLEVLGEKIAARNIRNVTLVHGEISKSEQRVDLIASFMTLHHIEDTKKFITEMREHLRENGRVVIGDLCAEDGSFHTTVTVPHNGFDTQYLVDEFCKQGFRDVSTELLTTIERNGRIYEIFILTAQK